MTRRLKSPSQRDRVLAALRRGPVSSVEFMRPGLADQPVALVDTGSDARDRRATVERRKSSAPPASSSRRQGGRGPARPSGAAAALFPAPVGAAPAVSPYEVDR
jgi:hypothetical protein